jgi:hypothetical protein
MSESAIFTLVSIRSDREKIFARLIDGKLPFSFQAGNKLYKGRVFDREGTRLIFDCPEGPKLTSSSEVVASFSFPPEMYFMRTVAAPKGEHFALEIGKDLYKLQRRDNFRLTIPSNYRARFELQLIGSEPAKGTYNVIDLSGGGLSFEMLFAPDRMSAGSQVTGQLKVLDDFSRPVVGTVRHVRPFGSMGSGVFRVGVQFDGLSNSDRDEIIALVMKIHRASFSKFKML